MTGPSNRRWLRKWLRFEPHQIIGGADDPYLLRWYVLPRNPLCNVYLHKFLRSDDDRALHDHPWPFWSLILRGRYAEVTGREVRYRQPGSVAYRPARFRHRVELLADYTLASLGLGGGTVRRERPVWTLIVTGPRTRVWGFWCRRGRAERFVPWQEFGDAGCGETP